MHLGITESLIPFSGHYDLDLVLRSIVSRAYHMIFEVGIPNLVCKCTLGMMACHIPFLVSL